MGTLTGGSKINKGKQVRRLLREGGLRAELGCASDQPGIPGRRTQTKVGHVDAFGKHEYAEDNEDSESRAYDIRGCC